MNFFLRIYERTDVSNLIFPFFFFLLLPSVFVEKNVILGFTRFQLHNLCIIPAVLEYIRTVDLQFYQALVGVLIRDVLQNIPSQLTQHIRNFAKQLDKWMEAAMDGAPRELYSIKVKAVSSFAQMLRRYTSLNHLAQAARGVLNNPAQLSQMVADLERVNFRDIQVLAASHIGTFTV